MDKTEKLALKAKLKKRDSQALQKKMKNTEQFEKELIREILVERGIEVEESEKASEKEAEGSQQTPEKETEKASEKKPQKKQTEKAEPADPKLFEENSKMVGTQVTFKSAPNSKFKGAEVTARVISIIRKEPQFARLKDDEGNLFVKKVEALSKAEQKAEKAEAQTA